MQIISYNRELAISSVLFAKLFRNISINRQLPDNTIEACKIACVMGSRSRILKAFENGQQPAQFTLPMLSITRTGISRDSTRLSNLHNEVTLATHNKINYDLYTPVPVNIDYKVTLYAKYTADIDMILSNFMIFFNNDIFVSSEHPKYTNLRYSSQVIMHDTITESRNESLAATELDLVSAEISFTFKTYLFGGSRQITAGKHSVTMPVTAITEVTVVNPETGEPVIDPATSAISTITTQITSTTTDIYDGYIPVISALHIEMHAVPRADPFTYATDGSRINYDFIQYFQDVDNAKDPTSTSDRKITDPAYDCLEWIIDTETLDPDMLQDPTYNIPVIPRFY